MGPGQDREDDEALIWDVPREHDVDGAGEARVPLAVHLAQFVAVLALAVAARNRVGAHAPSEDVCRERPAEFCAFRALDTTKKLVDLGPRVFGYESNDVEAVEILQKGLQDIAKNSSVPIEVDVQLASGSFQLGMGDGMVMRYDGVRNVVARVSGEGLGNGGAHSSAILLNCHFDSVPLSPGASDNAVNCGIMMEALRAVSATNARPKRDIVFLFNGAEEVPLVASHAFVTQHPWANDIEAFINLEAAGSAMGKELLFQAGPGKLWILETYLKSVPHFSGTVIGQELFQGGLIPSDTDFRIFRDFGNLSGIDIAFVRNGYVYHTALDALDQIDASTVQRAGENVLAAARALADADAAKGGGDAVVETPVFFDFLGLFPVSYKQNGFPWVVTNVVPIILGIALIVANASSFQTRLDYVRLLSTIMILRILSLMSAGILVGVAAKVMIQLGLSMWWFRKPQLLVFIGTIPSLVSNLLIVHVVHDRHSPSRIPRDLAAKVFEDAHVAEFAIYSVLSFKVGSAYIFQLFVFSAAVFFLAKRMCSMRLQAIADLATPLFNPLMILPLLNSFYLILLLFDFFIPIMGRAALTVNGDLVVLVLATCFSHIAWSQFLPHACRSGQALSYATKILGTWTLLYLCLLLTHLSGESLFPYGAGQPMRMFVGHANRLEVDVEGREQPVTGGHGIAMYPEDNRDYAWLLDSLGLNYTLFDDCSSGEDVVNCALPFFSNRLRRPRLKYFVDFPPPELSKAVATKLRLRKRKKVFDAGGFAVGEDLHFELRGPPRVNAFLVAPTDAAVTEWDLTDNGVAKPSSYSFNNRSCYFVTFLRGSRVKDGQSMRRFRMRVMGGGSGDARMRIVVNGHHLHSEQRVTSKEYEDFLQRLPEWMFAWAWTVDWKVYNFDLQTDRHKADEAKIDTDTLYDFVQSVKNDEL